VQEALNDLEGAGILNREQAALLRRIYGRELFSVHWELRLLLYAGILILTTGVGLLIAALRFHRSPGSARGHRPGVRGVSPTSAPRAGSPEKLPAPTRRTIMCSCWVACSSVPFKVPGTRYQLLAHWSWLLGSGLLYLFCPLLRQPSGAPGPLHPGRLARREGGLLTEGGWDAARGATPSSSAPRW
jgi:hypothetical protein